MNRAFSVADRDKNSKLLLFWTHRDQLVDYAAPIVGCRSRAEDVVQDAYLRFAPARAADDGLGRPLSYLYRIVRNLALDTVRRRRVEERQEQDGGVWWMLPAEQADPEREFLLRRDVTIVSQGLAALPEDMRLAVEMHRFEGHTLEEIAQRLGVSVPTAHRLVHQGLTRLAARLVPTDTRA